MTSYEVLQNWIIADINAVFDIAFINLSSQWELITSLFCCHAFIQYQSQNWKLILMGSTKITIDISHSLDWR